MLKHPYQLNCSREIGHKTKLIPYSTNFCFFTSSTPSLSKCGNIISPQICFFLYTKLFMNWKLDNLGSLLQVYCKEGNFGFQLLFIEEIRLIWLKSDMLKHILRVGLEKLKLPRMAAIISCWLFSPRISPQSIIKQVLGLWALNPESPRRCS